MAAITEVRAEIWSSAELINVVVRVVDDTGREGVGETWWGIATPDDLPRAGRPMASVVNDVLAVRVVGRDADDITGIWESTLDWAYRYGDQGLLLMGLSGIDLALWDLRSRSAGQPVFDLMGGRQHDSLPAYASLPWLRAEEAVLHETRRAIDAGFDAVKLHETNPDFTAAVRREFGDDLTIMVDVNGHFDFDEAVEHGRQLSDYGVLWFEEPVRPMRDQAAIGRVCDSLDIAIAAGENEYTARDFVALVANTSVEYIQPELTKIGGLTAAAEIGTTIAEAGRRLCPHNFRVGPSMIASAHWAFSSPAGDWIEIPWFQADVACSFPMQLPRVEGGRVSAPDALGLTSWR